MHHKRVSVSRWGSCSADPHSRHTNAGFSSRPLDLVTLLPSLRFPAARSQREVWNPCRHFPSDPNAGDRLVNTSFCPFSKSTKASVPRPHSVGFWAVQVRGGPWRSGGILRPVRPPGGTSLKWNVPSRACGKWIMKYS